MRGWSWWWLASLPIVGCGQEASENASDSGADPAAAEAPAKAAGESAPGPAQAEAPKAPEPPVPAGHAVVRVGGALYASASSATPVVVPELGSRDTAAPGVTIDIVGEENGRLVVETLGGATGQHHCAGELSGLSDLRLRLYVDPKDLLSITTAPVEQAFADGTKIALSAGVPLAETGASDPLVQRANAAGVIVDVPVAKESRGTFHEPGQPRAREGALGKIHDDGDPPAPLRYGDGGVLSESGLYRDGSALAHYGVTSRDGDAFVTVRNACLEAIVRTSTSRLSPPPVATAGVLGMMAAGDEEDVWGGLTGTEIGEAYGVGGLGLVGTGRAAAEPTYTVRVGAPIHWEDGTVAGQVLSARELDGPSREVDGRRCFDVKIVAGKDAALSLCFAGSDLEEKPAEATGTIGLGSYGLIGRGPGYTGGSGGSAGIGLGKRPVPAVRQAKAAVKGSLDKDIIRRIVRAHINEVRYCYNKLLVTEPTAAGKVAVSFTIGADGKVSASSVTSNTTGDSDLGDCIAKAVKRWTFPKPTGGGIVTVSYPFVLEPG